MSEAWSREEVEATVADYFRMLEAELRGDRFNKAENNRNLRNLLVGRSHGAVERKHQNISAILLDASHPWIGGYKPLGNFQQLLFDVVMDHIADNREIAVLITSVASDPADAPETPDLLSLWVDPPALEPGTAEPAVIPYRGQVIRDADYVAIEARNRSLGLAGEQLVLRYEAERLSRAGQPRLANRIDHVSKTRGDGLGYDIHSFEVDGRERLIEVKTTSFHKRTPFHITRNELACSSDHADAYHLYRVFDFRKSPRLFGVPGRLDHSCRLDPVQYLGRVL